MLLKYMVFILSLVAVQAWAGTPHYIDLTHDFSGETLNWPTTIPFKINGVIAETTPAGFYISARDYVSHEHSGTHMDAPNHFAKGHPGVDGVPISHLIGDAIKIDVSKEVNHHSDYQIGIKDFQQWEKHHGKIPNGTIILLSTGFGNYWPHWEKYSGTKNTGAESVAHLHFPGLDPKAAEWLVNERKIKAVGIDTFSIDYGQTKLFATHQILTKNNIPIFENVASMDKLPANHFTIYALPMKIKEGTGAPLRIVAMLK